MVRFNVRYAVKGLRLNEQREVEKLMLTCECNHLRKEHESGKVNLEDSNVNSCMIKDCPCKQYHANYESRKQMRKIYFKAFFWSGLIITSVIVLGFVGNALIDAS